jgi:diaminohydroxyphosphoribosylaminopyrimidine deaminase/5-amino-6-(5-phosphoribosylamino)uracil reductase
MAGYDEQDIHFMKLALREARKGLGRTSPNPCVGAVVVKSGRLISKGYHHRAGTPHAEVNALERAGRAAKNATIYVTLEPCNHTGRTPPCTEKIISAGIRRVVVGMEDPNPLVNGGGNDYLASRGLEVVPGVIEKECHQLNRPFIKHVRTGLPWVIMKAGLSADGRIATRSGHSNWITGAESRQQVHRLRDRVDAILVGAGTALADDPSLTTRLPSGRGRDPLRVVLDSGLRLSAEARMFEQQSPAPTWVFCSEGADQLRKVELEKAGAIVKPVGVDPAGGLDLIAVLKELGSCGVTSLLVEGGGKIHASFLSQGLYDQANLFIAPLFIGGDGTAVVGDLGLNEVGQAKRFRTSKTRRFGEDVMIEGFFKE